MDDNVYVYVVDLPTGIHEMVTPCPDGYTIYLDISDSDNGRMLHYKHALKHIKRNDHVSEDIQDIESKTHLEDLYESDN